MATEQNRQQQLQSQDVGQSTLSASIDVSGPLEARANQVIGDDQVTAAENAELQCSEAVGRTRLSASQGSNPNRFPKAKFALGVGYIGSAYFGLQIQPDVVTVESVLENAIHRAGGISDDNQGDLQKSKWSRAARTDKGVHAAVNVVALKLRSDDPEIVDKINSLLPEDIRVFCLKRVTKGFNAKMKCSSRLYEYVCPSFMFAADAACDDGYRIDEQARTTLKELLSVYLGTHRYHNFTSGRVSMDASCNRFMRSFDVADTFVRDGIEWVALRVHGDSFMLHQIRKMVACVACVAHKLLPREQFAGGSFFDPATKWFLPIAPSRGLFLRSPMFDEYNKHSDKLGREALAFDDVADAVDAFVGERIYPTICEDVAEFRSWLQGLYGLGPNEIAHSEAIPETQRHKKAPSGAKGEQQQQQQASGNKRRKRVWGGSKKQQRR